MPKFRIIPRLEIKSGNLIKGMKMEGLKVIGKPEDFLHSYISQGADEIMYDDIVASLYERQLDFKNIKYLSEKTDIPLIISGGIRSIDLAKKAFRSGADKICLNTCIFKNKKFVKDLIKIYGSQSIACQIQTKEINGTFEVFSESGRERMEIKLFDWIKIIEALNFGEIYLISIDHDGTNKVPDTNFLKKCRKEVKIPLIYGGGVKDEFDIKKLKESGYNGALISNSLHSNISKIQKLNILK